jgi:hypothetical protein
MPMKGATYYVSLGGNDSNPGTITQPFFTLNKTLSVVYIDMYLINGIAAHNLNDTTVSSPVEFEVGSAVKYNADTEIIKLYPNPNNGHFSVEFINPLQTDKSEIIITDLSGKLVYSSPVLKAETLKHIDVSDNRSGMYVLMIKDKEILVTKKFIKN